MIHTTKLAAIGLAALCAVGAAAQTQSTNPVNQDEDGRLSVGFLAGGLLTGGVKSISTSVNTSLTNPPTVTDTLVESQASRYLFGGSVRYDLGESFGAGADFIYRRGGYDTFINLSEQLTTEDDGDLLLATSEETRANFIDVPILGRYYFASRSRGGARTFVTGGLAIRFATGLSSTSESTDSEGVTDTDMTAVGPANDVVAGIVLGAGIRAKDDVGVKVDIEFRVTRWLKPVFQSGPANSNPNQAEAMISFTF